MSKIQELRKALNANMLERESVIDGLLVGLLACESVFLLGKPGAGKSYGVKLLCQALTTNLFCWLMARTSTPDEVFGPLDIPALQQSDYRRLTTHKLPEARIAFIDEIFKGSAAMLNGMLGILGEEREFCNGKAGVIKVPLEMCIGASNEIPESAELAALYDRFPLRYDVDYLKHRENRKKMLTLDAKVKMPKLSDAELQAERKAVAAVSFSDAMTDLYLDLQEAIKNAGLDVSDRKWQQSKRIVKAYAHLQGHLEVESDDFEILENVLWTDPNERRTVQKVVRQLTNPLGESILQLTDGVEECVLAMKNGSAKAHETVEKVNVALRSLKGLGDPKANEKLRQAIRSVQKIYNSILEEALGMKREEVI